MNIQVISLHDSKRRIRFDKFNFKFDFFDAITNDLDNIFDKSISELIYGRQLKLGEIGCSLSHYYLAKKIVQTNQSWTLVLEDDAIIDDNNELIKFYNEIKNILKPTIFIIGQSKISKKNKLIHYLKQPIYEKFSINGFDVGIKDVNFCGTVSYFINLEAAKIISACKSVFWLADDWKIINNMGIDVFHIKKPLVYENLSLSSSIGNHVIDYNSFSNFPLSCTYRILSSQCKFFIYKTLHRKI